MTDNEIIKALEICADYENCVSIDIVLTYRGIPLQYLFENALDLINRQRAEIERLEKILDKRCDVCPAVSTAIKKFAEKLKAKATSTFWEERKYVDAEDIDDVLAELTEHKQTVSMIDGHIEE